MASILFRPQSVNYIIGETIMIYHVAEVTQLTASCQCLSNELVATCYTSKVNCLGIQLPECRKKHHVLLTKERNILFARDAVGRYLAVSVESTFGHALLSLEIESVHHFVIIYSKVQRLSHRSIANTIFNIYIICADQKSKHWQPPYYIPGKITISPSLVGSLWCVHIIESGTLWSVGHVRFLCIALSHYHRYEDLPEDVDLLKHLLGIYCMYLFSIYGSVCPHLTQFSCDYCENTCTLSYYHQQIGSMNH